MNKIMLTAGVAAGLLVTLAIGCTSSQQQQSSLPEEVTMSKEVLLDKIKGGWAGQTIGCTYGGPTEFKFNGTMIQDYHPIRWEDGNIKEWMTNGPGLYDDIYMDLTFVEVFDRLGLDAPVDSFAMAFANADYILWHANQAARFNILNGIMPPESGNWLNNPHADDLDFQIEADFSGLMSPGMPNSASEICDKIGHIMNYGNGWYGGVYVGAMYSLAFVSDDIEFIATEALKVIPKESLYYKCMHDVIGWYKKYPSDWKQTWLEVQRNYSEDIGCPDGVFKPYDIDATINSAYILIGLLYGEGDFFKTMDISTRCGQDSDCNPASAAGILGTIIGYSKIPEYWMKNLREGEDIDFAYTSSSFNKAYQMSYAQATQMIERNGGIIGDSTVTIKCQKPVSVKLEQAFTGMYPIMRKNLNKMAQEFGSFSFSGTGFALRGSVKSDKKDYVADLSVFVDGQLVQEMKLPADFNKRSQEVCWKYMLPKGEHTLSLKWNNPEKESMLHCGEIIVYSDAPVKFNHQ